MTLTRIKRRALTLLSAVFVLGNPIMALEKSSEHPNTHEWTLDNGLKIIVREDHRAPVVTTMVWYRVGSVDEPRGLGGISHMLEHMMFKGTDTLGPNEHSTIIANLGGRDNAFTSYDYTAYFENLPAWELETSFRLEADRMRNLKLKEEDFAPERLVVAEERRQRTDSNPQGRFYEAYNATVWTTSAYRNPIIGWMPEIENWSLNDLKEWYERFYAPNNATLVVVGDVDPEETYQLALKYFGDFKASEDLSHPNEFEVPQTFEKRMEMVTDVNMPLIFMSYKVPSINSAKDPNDVYALILAAEILDGSSSARLSKNLVRDKQSALQASSYYNSGMRYDSTFMLSAVPAINVELESLEAQLKAEIKRLQSELVSQAELDRVINLYKASKVYEKDSVYYQAMQIGAAETTGEGWRHRENILNHLEKVTPEAIQAVAQRYFVDQNLTVGLLRSDKKEIDISNTPVLQEEK